MNINNKKSVCKYAGKCSGCQLLNLTYEKQLSYKMQKAIGALKPYCRVSEIIPSPKKYNYRNKAQAVFNIKKDGKTDFGIYQSSTNTVINCDNCRIQDEECNKLLLDIRSIALKMKIRPYEIRKKTGALRQIVLRKAMSTNELLVCIITATKVLPHSEDLCKAILASNSNIKTIVHSVNTDDKLFIGKVKTALYGEGYITDYLCGHKFVVSADSFYQINKEQTENMYKKAIEFASLDGSEFVLDAYCGIGTIGITASANAKKVIGVEVNKIAIKDAVKNARINNIDNINFICADAGDYLNQLDKENKKIDVLFMDPPRAGSSRQFLNAVGSIRPKKIVYISCNVDTLARDIAFLKRSNYKVEKAVPFDMFPQTNHVECVCLMSRVEKQSLKRLEIKK